MDYFIWRNFSGGGGFPPVELWSAHSPTHYSDVIMGAMASQITSLTIVLLNGLFRHRSKKASKLCFTGLCMGNSQVTSEFPAQKASNAENVPFDDVMQSLTSSRKIKKFKDHKCVTINLIWIIGCYILISSFIRMILTVSVAVKSNLHDDKKS